MRFIEAIVLCIFMSFSLSISLNMTTYKSHSKEMINPIDGEPSSFSVKPTLGLYENITTNIGDIIVDGNKSYTIVDCEFNQVGNITVKENATLIMHNVKFNQTGPDRVGIMLYDQARLIVKDSILIISQNFDSNIYVRDESTLNITNSNIINSLFGICIWVEDYNTVHIQNSNMMGGNAGGIQRHCVIMAMNYTMVHVQNTTLDRIAGWNDATIFVQNCTLRESMKIFNYVKVYVSHSTVDYVWASQNCTIYFQHSIVNSSNPLEFAVRVIHQSSIWFKHSSVRGGILAVNNAKVWLINTSVGNVSLSDEAAAFAGWELPLFGEVYVPYTMAPIVESAAIVTTVAVAIIIIFVMVKKFLRRSTGVEVGNQ